MTYFPSVFVSSSPDPKDRMDIYRATARDAILEAHMNPILWDYYGLHHVGANRPDLSRQMIDDSDIFLGIHSGQYGAAKVDEYDWVEFEYDYAVSKNKLMLFYFPHRTHPHFGQLDEKSTQFRNKVRRYLVHQNFTDEIRLRSNITTQLGLPRMGGRFQGTTTVIPLFGEAATHSQYDADAFMIMPFSPDLRPVYDAYIKPLVESVGMKIKRGDDFFHTHAIMNDVWSGIFRARVVIADCTGRNANVFYELGIAHTLGRKFIMLTQSEQDIPFDLRQYRYIHYSMHDLDKLRGELKEALERLDLVPNK